ncbi:MAG: glycosyltransferase [Bacteroidales bacterium]|nr:glycosyltransferase [Bacteroidales bacterium]
MAVNIANGLSETRVGSHLCATRTGGPLEVFVDEKVSFFVANKSGFLDWRAFFGIRKYIRRNNIAIIHAHSSSVFWAVLLKLITPGIKVVWHDHFGLREMNKSYPVLRLTLMAVNHVFVVSEDLFKYAVSRFKIKPDKVTLLNNFAHLDFTKDEVLESDLPNSSLYPKLICLANIRKEKDHENLLKSFLIVKRKYVEAQLYLVGGHFQDAYYDEVLNFINREPLLKDSAHVLGSRNDIPAILKVCDVGILASKFEGLPVSVLEYGLANLPVVCTNVGGCSDLLDGGLCGALVPARDAEALAKAIVFVLDSPEEAQKKSLLFNERVEADFSRNGAVKKILQVYLSVRRLRGKEVSR